MRFSAFHEQEPLCRQVLTSSDTFVAEDFWRQTRPSKNQILARKNESKKVSTTGWITIKLGAHK